MLGMALDITTCKEAEKSLRQSSETRYRTLIEHLPTVTYMAMPEIYGQLLYLSPQFEHLLGFSVAEWMATPHLWDSRIHPEDRAAMIDARTRVGRTGEQVSVACRYLARDGHVVWIEEQTVVVRDSAGQPLWLLGIMQNITVRKQAEEALRASEERFRTLVEHLPTVTYIAPVGDEGIPLYVSPQSNTLWGSPRPSGPLRPSSGSPASIPTTATARWPRMPRSPQRGADALGAPPPGP